MPFITYPNVPTLPGVPQLPFQKFAGAFGAGVTSVSGAIATASALLTADDPSIHGVLAPPEWGLFDQDNNPVLAADAVISVERMSEWRLSDYPIEGGLFDAFDKVTLPFEARVTLACGGSVANRRDFLATLDDIAGGNRGYDLYTVVTPDATYPNVSVLRYDYRRTAENGAQLLVVEIVVRQVRIAPDPAFTNTKDPSGAANQNGGTVQAQTPSAIQSSAAAQGAS